MTFWWLQNAILKIKCVFKHILFYESSCMTADKNVKWPKIKWNVSDNTGGRWPFDYFKTHYLKIKYVFKHISFYGSSCMTADKNVKWPKIKWNESDHTGSRWPFRDFKRTKLREKKYTNIIY